MIKGNFGTNSLTRPPKHVGLGLICYNFSLLFIIDIYDDIVRARCENVSEKRKVNKT